MMMADMPRSKSLTHLQWAAADKQRHATRCVERTESKESMRHRSAEGHTWW